MAFQLQGIDSAVWQGAAQDSGGKLWIAFSDADPSGGSDSRPTLSVLPCRAIRFVTKGGEVLDCEPVSSVR